MFSREFVKSIGFWPFLRRFVWRQVNKRLFGRGVSLRLPTGLTMYAPPWSTSASEVIYTNADEDWGAEELFVEHLDKNGIFIDVGAHVGYYSLYAAPRVKRIYAFEPDVLSFQALSQNLAQCAHAEAIQKAVFSKSGEMRARVREGTGFTHLFGSDEKFSVGSDGRSHVVSQSVGVVSIDDWMRNRPGERVTGIKVDVDGLDLQVIKGAETTVRQDQPVVLTEFGASDVNKFDDLFDLLDRLGYSAFAFQRSKDARYRFRRLTRENASYSRIKMIFLTPRRLNEVFVSNCEGLDEVGDSSLSSQPCATPQ